MKLRTLLLCALLAARASAVEIVSGGTVFHDCTQIRVVGAELQFIHASGNARVRYDALSLPLQKQYFTAERLAELRKQDESAAAAQRVIEANRDAVARKEYEQHKAAMERKASAAAAELSAKKERERAETAARQKVAAEKAERIANYASGQWERFIATMSSPAKNGQLMRKPDGTVIYVGGDFGIAQGEKKRGYFERVGNYDYTSAGGGTARVQSYAYRGDAREDMGKDLIEVLELKLKLTKRTITSDEISRLATLQVRLEAEGESPILLR